MHPHRRVAALLVFLATVACRTAVTAPEASATGARWDQDNPVIPLPKPPLGLEADLTRAQVVVTPEKVRLGRWLFYDVRLSRDHTISCASCHHPENAFSEPTAHSTGVGGRQGTRKAPPIVNAGFPVTALYFWDGRATSLPEQAKGPITNPVEMANTEDVAAATVAGIAGYRRAFREVYGDSRLDIDRIVDAIAAYETTRLSGSSAFDRFNAGDTSALSDEAQAGLEIFFGRGRCNACHLGPTFSDSRFHNVGVGFDPGRRDPGRTGFADPGRYAISHDPADIGAFKTPTLRDVTRHAPYMHDGSSPDLRDAVSRYVLIQENPWLDPAMREVQISPPDVQPLIAFLEALDGTGYEDVPPTSFPR